MVGKRGGGQLFRLLGVHLAAPRFLAASATTATTTTTTTQHHQHHNHQSPQKGEAEFWKLWELFNVQHGLSGVDVPAMLAQAPKLAGLFLVVCFGSCMDVAAIQSDMPTPLDFNRELMTVGACPSRGCGRGPGAEGAWARGVARMLVGLLWAGGLRRVAGAARDAALLSPLPYLTFPTSDYPASRHPPRPATRHPPSVPHTPHRRVQHGHGCVGCGLHRLLHLQPDRVHHAAGAGCDARGPGSGGRGCGQPGSFSRLGRAGICPSPFWPCALPCPPDQRTQAFACCRAVICS